MMDKAGLFSVSYQITSGLTGAPVFQIHLSVSEGDRHVSGAGEINIGNEDPVKITTDFLGDFSYMSVIPKSTKILVMLAGQTQEDRREVQNTIVRMVLEDNWEKGIASFSFLGADKQWQEERQAKVHKITATDTVAVMQ